MTEEELEEQRRLEELLLGVNNPAYLPGETLREHQNPSPVTVQSQWDRFVQRMQNVNKPEGGLDALAVPTPPGVFEDQGKWLPVPTDRFGNPLPLPSGGLASASGDVYFQPGQPAVPHLTRNFDESSYRGFVGDQFEKQALAAHWKTITTMAPRPQFRPFHQTSFTSVPFQFKLGPTAAGKQKSGGLYSF